jgi:hypothetical protein
LLFGICRQRAERLRQQCDGSFIYSEGAIYNLAMALLGMVMEVTTLQ